MSTTSYQLTKLQWLRILLSGRPHQVIGQDDGGAPTPYLRRWYVIPRNPLLNVYLHQFLRSDDDRALHDHPWWFVSLMLRGQYDEITDQGVKRRRAGSVAFRPAEWRHRVQLLPALDMQQRLHDAILRRTTLLPPGTLRAPEIPCWTLIITGRRSRTWGFWCKRIVDPWTARSNDELDQVYRNGGTLEVDRFIKWDEFGDAGCGEPA